MSDRVASIVYLVDDDAAMRRSLRMLVESAGLNARVYDSAAAFLADLHADSTGCVVLDLHLPDMNGIEVLERLRDKMFRLRVVIISAHADVPEVVRCMKLGAVDFFQKPVEPSILLEAIRNSVEVDQAVCEQRKAEKAIIQRFERLTMRERELLSFVVDGHANKRIAIRMGISIRTVANHRASLMSKTAAANAADLGRLYVLFQSMNKSASDSAAGRIIRP